MTQMKTKKTTALTFLQLVTGCALTACAFGMIILPLGLAASGVTGVSSVLAGIIPIPLSLMVLAINSTLLLVGLVLMGKAFAAKTVAASLLFPLMLEIASQFPLHFLSSHILAGALLGGLMLGIGIGLILRSGASTGGFDIIAVVLNSRYKIPVAVTLNITDASIILMQAFKQGWELTLLGVLAVTVSAFAAGKVATRKGGKPAAASAGNAAKGKRRLQAA